MQLLKISLLVFIQQTKFSFKTSFVVITALLSFYQTTYSQVGEWKVFNTQNSTVPQNTFYCIGIDKEERLWLAHHAVCVWDLKNSACYTSNDYPDLGSDIVAIHGDSAGYVWLSLESPWLIKTNSIDWETQFLDGAMWAVSVDKNNNLWCGGGLREGQGLNKFDGNNWTVYDTSNSPLPYNYVRQITCDSNGKIWGISSGINGRAIFCFDGTNWEIYPAYLPPEGISTMVADKKGNIWYVTGVPQTGFGGIVQINDSMFVFHPNPDSIIGSAQKLLVDSNDNLWVCWYNCVYEYSEGLWSAYRDTIDYRFSDMIIDSKDNIWFSTWGDGVVAFNKNGLVLSTDKQDNSVVINDFRLEQNYPNPFNPSTKIKYSIPPVTFRQAQRDILVTLKVYDILGKEIAKLVNEEKPAGEYQVEFDGNGLPSGIYFYQLKAGSYIETRKMVLIK
ncbi:MAG: T9SS type A sorting domain-containing protein [bacterium]|nr:T9SS type A sorting domain-containing protein [bacterium]